MKYFYIYLTAINILSVIVTVYDKNAAVRGARRVRERNLFLLSVLGGSPAMYLTMLVINHKTRKLKFMLGIPLIALIQLAIFLVLRYGLRMV